MIETESNTPVPSRPHQVLGLDFARSDLTILCALLDVLHEFLFLVLQLDALPVQFSLRPIESPLVFA